MTIEEFYSNRTTKRSGVPLMNHIHEGEAILKSIGGSLATITAYRLHPIYQNDVDLEENYRHLHREAPEVVMLVMEYRNIANRGLSDIVHLYPDWNRHNGPSVPTLKKPIEISPIEQVNKMLIADKVQNWKDFKQYHQTTHPRAKELDFYFRSWIKALGLSEGEALFLEEICYGIQRRNS